jgi:hypothetical protein
LAHVAGSANAIFDGMEDPRKIAVEDRRFARSSRSRESIRSHLMWFHVGESEVRSERFVEKETGGRAY